MNINDFRQSAHSVVDWMADYLEQIETYPVRPVVNPGDLLAKLPAHPPETKEDFAGVFADFQSLILPGMMHWQHPGFFGYFPANSSVPSVLAEMTTAVLGAQCMSWETSPAATELEMRVMEWLRGMLGLPADFVGSIQDTASTGSLVALLVARERALNHRGNAEGPGSSMTVYCSEEAHSSIQKAVRIAGLGDDRLRLVLVDDQQGMRPDELERMMSVDRAAGLTPVAVVACLGTTGTSGFDPIRAVSEVCRRHGAWLHVDAAWAGSALLVPEHRWMIDGIEGADSLVVNPHKWMFTNFDCSVLFVRDPRELVRAMSILPEYLKTAEENVVNYRDWGIQLGRRFRALKLWFVIRTFGVEGLRQIISNHISWAHELAEAIAAEPGFEVLRPPVLSLFCFRYVPAGGEPSEVDHINERLLRSVNASGRVYLTHTRVQGRFVIRFVAGQTHTTREHVMDVLSCLRESVLTLE